MDIPSGKQNHDLSSSRMHSYLNENPIDSLSEQWAMWLSANGQPAVQNLIYVRYLSLKVTLILIFLFSFGGGCCKFVFFPETSVRSSIDAIICQTACQSHEDSGTIWIIYNIQADLNKHICQSRINSVNILPFLVIIV